MFFTHRLKWGFVAAATALLLAGCGGGASSSDRPAAGQTASGASASVAAGADVAGMHPTLVFAAADDQSQPPANAYTPTQMRQFYNLTAITNQGAGQTIAVIEAFGSRAIVNDLTTFCQQFNLPLNVNNVPTLQIATPGGAPTCQQFSWTIETSLDVEWAHAMAPLATILLVVAPTNSDTDLLGAVDYANTYVNPVTGKGVCAISMSWGGGEYVSETIDDQMHFTASGITYFAASGDGGAGVIYPSVSPYVVGVGGTHLNPDAVGTPQFETAWPQSGGGPSQYETEPAYQQEWQTSGMREAPDVSYYADVYPGIPVIASTGIPNYSGWFRVGGTSCGCPQWSAIMALMNEQRTSPLDNMPSQLYTLGAPKTQTTYFRDIVLGSNGLQPGGLSFDATVGYDQVTGLGSPLGQPLVTALVAATNSATPSGSPSSTIGTK